MKVEGVYWSQQMVKQGGVVFVKVCVSNSSHSCQVIQMKLATHDPYEV